MPGLVGLITRKPRVQAESELRKMMSALIREDFYSTGMWIDEQEGVYLGWMDRNDGIPRKVLSGSGRADVVLAFSGQDFQDSDTIQRLQSMHSPDPDDSHSYLVHLYEEDPASFFRKLNGRFHGLLLDRNRGTVEIFNDRYSMNRLYVHETPESVFFSAEAKAILAVCPHLQEIDPRSLGEFLACGAVLENRTLFRSISVLPGGSVWRFKGRSLQKKDFYFEPSEWERQSKLPLDDYYRELHQVFSRNLRRYFHADERIAMSLTGGLDSRMILAHRRPAPGSLPCYTFGSMYRDNHDVRVARKLAEVCGQSHQVITAGREFLSEFANFAESVVFLSDGCVDVGRAPDLYLNQRARTIAPVRMAGTYGGEVLRGVRAFKAADPNEEVLAPDLLPHFSAAKVTCAAMSNVNPVSFAVFKLSPWALYGILGLEGTQVDVRCPFLDNDFVATVFRSPSSALESNEVSLRLIADGDKKLLEIPTDRGIAGNQGRLRQKISRAALEFTFKAEYAYDMGMPQWLAKTDCALKPLHLERMFLGRHKPFHFRVWYRDFLGSYLKEMLLDDRALSRPYVQAKGLANLVTSHVKGTENHTNELNTLLTLELVHRLFLDSPGRGNTLTPKETQFTIA